MAVNESFRLEIAGETHDVVCRFATLEAIERVTRINAEAFSNKLLTGQTTFTEIVNATYAVAPFKCEREALGEAIAAASEQDLAHVVGTLWAVINVIRRVIPSDKIAEAKAEVAKKKPASTVTPAYAPSSSKSRSASGASPRKRSGK